MAGKVDADTALTLRELLLNDIPLDEAAQNASEALQPLGIKPPSEAAARASQFIAASPSIDDPELVDELTKYYNKVVDDGHFAAQMLTFPNEVAASVGFPLSDRASTYLKSLDPDSLVDMPAPPKGIPPWMFQPDGFPPDWPRDQWGQIIINKVPRPSGPSWPNVDPAQKHQSLEWRSVVIAVAIGAILLHNKGDKVGGPVLDRSGLERL